LRYSAEKLRLLREEHKALLPARTKPENEIESEPPRNDGDAPAADRANTTEMADETVIESDGETAQARGLRGGNDRVAERMRKREVQEEKKKARTEAAAKQPKQIKAFIKLSRAIEKEEEEVERCEKEIAILDNDLREADCPRTRVLGHDRFWNRYYWFERNGMPFGGLPNSSTASAGYANGRLWVQGPDEMERCGYVDVPEHWAKEYKMQHGETVAERKVREEGTTRLHNAREWGYYDEPEAVDALMEWLDTRGTAELKLHKELKLYREHIVQGMRNRRAYLYPAEGGAAGDAEEDEELEEERARRKRHSARVVKRESGRRSSRWRNTMALHQLEHLHSEPPRARGRPKGR
jgi:hypothetical protein